MTCAEMVAGNLIAGTYVLLVMFAQHVHENM